VRILVPLALVPALVLGAATASARTPRRCDALGGTTVARDRQIRVFSTQTYGTRLFGCTYRTRRVVLVYPADGDDGGLCGTLSLLRLAGHMVALSFDSCGGGGTYYEDFVVVRDAASGRTVRRVHSAPDQAVSTAAIVVRADGAVGWIWRDCGAIDLAGRSCRYLVQKFDRTGAQPLDSGAVDPHSLTLRRSRMSWTNGRVRRSARLR
jgi:hypothetical protein